MKRAFIAAFAVALLATGASASATAPETPLGLTAIALDGSVGLAWQPVAGADHYSVYRGTSAASVTDQVTPAAGVAGASFVDTSPANGTAYYYAVRAVSDGLESTDSQLVQTTPAPRSCSSGNDVVLENCFPGSSAWILHKTPTVAAGGIEGFATASSVQRGGSLDLKIRTAVDVPYSISIYRSGYYGGAGGRLFSVLTGFRGAAQPACTSDSSTGLYDCSNWSVSATISTTDQWPTGVYLARLVRGDDGAENEILFTVRDDGTAHALLYGLPFATYEAYNNYGGKSFYGFNSTGANTVAGTTQAVKVSFDRPFEQARSAETTNFPDWYTRADFPLVSWLEREGYDVGYGSNTDLERNGATVRSHQAYTLGAHDEYYSSAMRAALEQGRDAGVSLLSLGGNSIYWRIRFENGPGGGTDRVQVCYKTTSSYVRDPLGPTGTWRDPAGANRPENALLGAMYVGDNSSMFFPLAVSAAQGTDRIFRYTPLHDQAAGTSTAVGTSLVGWEWDSRVANGFEPAGVKTVAASPAGGNMIQSYGAGYLTGPGTVTSVKYRSPSGALVFAAGTNQWDRGLALNGDGAGEPDRRIQQVTTNVLEDMGIPPATPASDIVLDDPAAPDVAVASPADGAASVATGASVSATFTHAMNPTTITGSTFTLSSPDGPVAAQVSYDGTSRTATLTPSAPLASGTTFTARLGTEVTDSGGRPLQYDQTWTFTTSGCPCTLFSDLVRPTNQSAGGSYELGVKLQVTQPLTVRALRYYKGFGETGTHTGSVWTANGFRLATVTFANETASGWQQQALPAPLQLQANTTYVVSVNANSRYAVTPSGLASQVVSGPLRTVADGQNGVFSTTLGAFPDQSYLGSNYYVDAVIGQGNAPAVTARAPAADAVGAAPNTPVQATFTRPLDPLSATSASFTLSAVGGSPVAATVDYDPGTQRATLTPSAPLAPSTTYTATLTTAISAIDGVSLAEPVTWSFTTSAASSIPPTVVSTSPGDGALRSSVVTARFSRDLDAGTVSGSTFSLRRPDGSVVPAQVSYDAATSTARLVPAAQLAPTTSYTARLDGSIQAVDGTPLGAAVSWSFTTTACPYQLFGDQASPVTVGHGTYELGVKLQIDSPVELTKLRFYKAAGETGSHTGTVWTAGGTPLERVTFSGETASGWQQQNLPTPLELQGNHTYIVSVNVNTAYAVTLWGLSGQVSNGPLHTVADGNNGLYGQTQGAFPDQSYASSNYFVDVAADPVTSGAPVLLDTSPHAGAGAARPSDPLVATFSRPLDPGSLGAGSFELRGPDGSVVPATVSYDGAYRLTLTPAQPLTMSTQYTASLASTIASAGGTQLGTGTSWSFTTASCPCSLYTDQTQPANTSAGGSYELGVKLQVAGPLRLTAIRFYKAVGETGSHTAIVWSAAGVPLASVTFSSESASGWQQQALATPLNLLAGTTYVVSVNTNSRYAVTTYGLANAVSSGPLRTVDDGANGVYSETLGTFPSQSYASSSYFVDAVVAP